jgi:hypothetical protein
MSLTFISSASVLGKRICSVEDYWKKGWEQLGDNDPWKLFGDYWRKQHVQTTRDKSFITLAYEERGEGDPKYRLSLAIRTQNRIIVRDCYKALYDLIRKKRVGSYNGLILTGQPGTGASSL